MSNLNRILTFEHESEHDLEHNLPLKNLFSIPKIYTGKGDLSKRWYVYFSYRNPKTGKLQRMQNVYGKANKYTTKEDRLFVLTVYKRTLLKLLKEGFNPFEDNTALLAKRKGDFKPSKASQYSGVDTTKEKEASVPIMSIKEAFDFGLKLKEKLLSKTTKRAYENRIKNFLKWVEDVHPEISTIDKVDRKLVTQFLNHVLVNTSARNRNNFRVDLSSLIQVLEDNDIVATNFMKRIPVLKSIPQRNKTYSNEKQEEIYTFLEKQDALLLLYIKFISYNFLRPIEVCRLKVGDIDLKNKLIKFKAKNSPLKTKIIPDLLINDLPDLSKMDKSLCLFTPEQIGGKWETDVDNKRDYFSKRFKKVVKDPFGLGKDYGLYSFRHTYITKLYRALVKGSSPFEAKSKLMLITGHSSMSALQKYLRDIDAELPEDYSEHIK
ncbi:site-specific integrase [Winogradskyella psychrotolerans]|uniref:Site-specific recombinase XerD n=1 Tax=Winogradskyella damuponensis TaxID=943939 RepID=A0ABP8CLJ0_9FLAO|nr:site-specific integrase [Winogradskyella psychrotolerans]MBU2923013.1 site-specific integrase [Winogradskyella psychrotolerans]